MKAEIDYLKAKHPDKSIWQSLEPNYINVRTLYGFSKFQKDGIDFTVDITGVEKVHIDTVRLMIITKS